LLLNNVGVQTQAWWTNWGNPSITSL